MQLCHAGSTKQPFLSFHFAIKGIFIPSAIRFINKEGRDDFRNAIFSIHLRFYLKAKNQRHVYMKHLYQYLRLLIWQILDAIDRKLGPGPGDHRT